MRKTLSNVLDAMDEKGEKITSRTVREQVEDKLDRDLEGAGWKDWLKDTANEIMEEWSDGESGSDDDATPAKATAKSDAAADSEYDTPDTTSKANKTKVTNATEDVMEEMEEKEEPMKSVTIQHKVSVKMGLKKIDSPHWTKWFKTTCGNILTRWDEEDAEGDEGLPDKFTDCSKSDLDKVFKQLEKVVNPMLDADQDLSLKLIRERVEKALDAKLTGPDWNKWLKGKINGLLEKWDEEHPEDGSDFSDEDEASASEGGAAGAKYVDLADASDDLLTKIEDKIDEILDEMEDNGEEWTIAIVQEKIKKEMKLDLSGKKWKKWIEEFCDGDEEDDE